MARHGFIRGKLEIKMLVLYIMDKMVGPIDTNTIYDLTFCDPGVDYFDFIEGLGELVETKHLAKENDRYTITQKGRQDNIACESSLPFSVKRKCDINVVPVNDAIYREAMVKAYTEYDKDGILRVKFILNDLTGNLFTLDLVSPSQEQADILCKHFKTYPERIFNEILTVLSPQEPKVEEKVEEDAKETIQEDAIP